MHAVNTIKKEREPVWLRYMLLLSLIILLLAVLVSKNKSAAAVDSGTEVEVNDVIETINVGSNNSGKVIVIDPGHGAKVNNDKELSDPESDKERIKAPVGGVGIFTKVPEYKINYQVAMKLKKLLEKKGFSVVMTKTNIEENPSGIERAVIGNEVNARLVVKIHADSFKDPSANGASIQVPAPINTNTRHISKESSRCGGILMKMLVQKAGVKGRGVFQRSELTSLNWSKVPAIIIEMGFLSNKREDILLNSEEYQNRIAQAISDGIEEAVKIQWDE